MKYIDFYNSQCEKTKNDLDNFVKLNNAYSYASTQFPTYYFNVQNRFDWHQGP